MELLAVLMKVETPATEFPVKANCLRAQVAALNSYHKQNWVMLATGKLLTLTVLVWTAVGMTR